MKLLKICLIVLVLLVLISVLSNLDSDEVSDVVSDRHPKHPLRDRTAGEVKWMAESWNLGRLRGQQPEATLRSIENREKAEKIYWIKCCNPDCEHEWQMDMKDYWVYMKENQDPMSMAPPAIACPDCGEKSGYRAEKCEKCGLIFERRSVHMDFSDRCPGCGYSRSEAMREVRKSQEDVIIRTPSLFYQIFGEPKSKSLIDDYYYFYYKCKDGIVQLQIPYRVFEGNNEVWINSVNIY